MLNFNTGSFNTGGSDEKYIDLSARVSIDTNMYSRKIPASSEIDRGFNSIPFNTSKAYEDMYQMNFGLEYAISQVTMTIETDMQAMPGFDADMDAITSSIETNMITTLIREMSPPVLMSIDTNMQATAAYYEQSYLELIGSFAPGDRIVVDASKLTVTKNGQNALHMLRGDFVELNLGPNQIQYSDDAAARNVLMRVTHQDRYV